MSQPFDYVRLAAERRKTELRSLLGRDPAAVAAEVTAQQEAAAAAPVDDLALSPAMQDQARAIVSRIRNEGKPLPVLAPMVRAPQNRVETSDEATVAPPQDLTAAYRQPASGEGADIELPTVEEHPEALSGIGRVGQAISRTLFLLPEEVHTYPESTDDRLKRKRGSDLEMRRLTSGMPQDVRDSVLSAPTKQEAARRAASYRFTSLTGGAFPLGEFRGAPIWDVDTAYQQLYDAKLRELRREYPEATSMADFKALQARAKEGADENLAPFLMLDTGHYGIVKDVGKFKERLAAMPWPQRFLVAGYSSPTDIVYTGTQSRLSTSKWSPLDVFSKWAMSTPVGATFMQTPPDDLLGMVARGNVQVPAAIAGQVATLPAAPMTAALAGLGQATGINWLKMPEEARQRFADMFVPRFDKPGLIDMFERPETAELVTNGVDILLASGIVGEAVKRSDVGQALGLKDVNPVWIGAPITFGITMFEPDAISAMFAPIGLATDAARATRAGSGIGRIIDSRDVVARAVEFAEKASDDTFSAKQAGEILAADHPLQQLHIIDAAAAEMGIPPSFTVKQQLAQQAAEVADTRRVAAEQSLAEAIAARAPEEQLAQHRWTVASTAYEADMHEVMKAQTGLESAAAGLEGVLRAIPDAKLTKARIEHHTALFQVAERALEKITGTEAVRKLSARLEYLQSRLLAAWDVDAEAEVIPKLLQEIQATTEAFYAALHKGESIEGHQIKELLAEYAKHAPYWLLTQQRESVRGYAKQLKDLKAKARGTAANLKRLTGRSDELMSIDAKIEKLRAKIAKAEAVMARPGTYRQVFIKHAKKLLASYDALLSIPRTKAGAFARRAVRSAPGPITPAQSKLVLDPALIGASEVNLRVPTWEGVLDSAITKIAGKAEDDTLEAIIEPQKLLDVLDEAYGLDVVAKWMHGASPEADILRRRLPPEALARLGIKPAEVVPQGGVPPTLMGKVGATTPSVPPLNASGEEAVAWTAGLGSKWNSQELIELQHAMEQLHNYARPEVMKRAGVAEAFGVVSAAEQDIVEGRAYGKNPVLNVIRKATINARRFLDREFQSLGVLSKQMVGIVRGHELGADQAAHDMNEVVILAPEGKRVSRAYQYADTNQPIPHARGATKQNARSTTHTMWMEFQDHVRSVRGLARAAKADRRVAEVARGGGREAKYGDILAGDEALVTVARMWVGRGVEAGSPDQAQELIEIALPLIDMSQSFEQFVQKFHEALYARGHGVDVRDERSIVTGLQGVIQGQLMRETERATWQALGDFATVEDAMAVNAALVRGTNRPEYDAERTVLLLTKLGMPFHRAAKRHEVIGEAKRIADTAKELVAFGMDETTGRAFFYPRMLADAFAEQIRNATKRLEPFTESADAPALLRAWRTLHHALLASYTVGFGIPKISYTITNNVFGDLTWAWVTEGIGRAGSLLVQGAPTHFPLYGRVFQKLHDKVGATLPSAFGSFVNPYLGYIFSGRQGKLRLGNRVYAAEQIRKMLIDDGILEAAVGEELFSSLEAMSSTGPFSKMTKWWQNEIVAHAELVQQRQRAALYLQLLDEGVTRAEAQRRVHHAFYNWKHGLTQLESNFLLKLNVPFYRFWRLALAEGVRTQLDLFTKSGNPEYWVEAAMGRTAIARVRKQAAISGAIPDWMASNAQWNNPEIDEYDATMLAVTGKNTFSRARLSWAFPTPDKAQGWSKDTFGINSPLTLALGPELTGSAVYSWWLNIEFGLAAMGASAAYPAVFETRAEPWSALMESNISSMLGPYSPIVFAQAEAFRGERIKVSPGEALMLKQIEAMRGWLYLDPNVTVDPEDGSLRADAGDVFIIRNLPLIVQIPRLLSGTSASPWYSEGYAKGIEKLFLSQLGIQQTYARDPDEVLGARMRHEMSALTRRIDAEHSRSGAQPRGTMFHRHKPLEP